VDIQLKQRLVGAVVLVALAVIFIPMILPGEGDLSGIGGSNIPSEPDFRFPPAPVAPKAPPVAEAPLVPLGDEQGDEQTDEADAPSTSADKPEQMAGKAAVEIKPEAKPRAKPKPKPKPKPKTVTQPVAKAVPEKARPGQVNGWVVQVGSFADRKNARALRDKLRKQGHASFVESVKGASGRVYRVRVGPELTRAAADKLNQRLAKEAGLKGLVQAYP
jgi:DedD protein